MCRNLDIITAANGMSVVLLDSYLGGIWIQVALPPLCLLLLKKLGLSLGCPTRQY